MRTVWRVGRSCASTFWPVRCNRSPLQATGHKPCRSKWSSSKCSPLPKKHPLVSLHYHLFKPPLSASHRLYSQCCPAPKAGCTLNALRRTRWCLFSFALSPSWNGSLLTFPIGSVMWACRKSLQNTETGNPSFLWMVCMIVVISHSFGCPNGCGKCTDVARCDSDGCLGNYFFQPSNGQCHGCFYEEGYYYSGVVLNSTKAASYDDCCALCHDVDTCVKWSYRGSDSLCELKPDKAVTRVLSAEWTSGIPPKSRPCLGQYAPKCDDYSICWEEWFDRYGGYIGGCLAIVTLTPTPTCTQTSSSTHTATNTLTTVPTMTESPSYTCTSTDHQSRTATISHTATPSRTSRPTASMTATRTCTHTLPLTLTVTQSATTSGSTTSTPPPTLTESTTAGATASASATRTTTGSRTLTTTACHSFTASATDTVTPQTTQTLTAHPSRSITPTMPLSPSSTLTLTHTHTATATVTATATTTATVTPSSSNTHTFTLSPTRTRTRSPSFTTTMTTTLTPHATTTPSLSSTLTGTTTTTATSSVTQSHTATCTMLPTTTCTQTPTATPPETMTPVPTVSSTASYTLTHTQTETPSSTSLATPTPTPLPTVTMFSSATPSCSTTPVPNETDLRGAPGMLLDTYWWVLWILLGLVVLCCIGLPIATFLRNRNRVHSSIDPGFLGVGSGEHRGKGSSSPVVAVAIPSSQSSPSGVLGQAELLQQQRHLKLEEERRRSIALEEADGWRVFANLKPLPNAPPSVASCTTIPDPSPEPCPVHVIPLDLLSKHIPEPLGTAPPVQQGDRSATDTSAVWEQALAEERHRIVALEQKLTAMQENFSHFHGDPGSALAGESRGTLDELMQRMREEEIVRSEAFGRDCCEALERREREHTMEAHRNQVLRPVGALAVDVRELQMQEMALGSKLAELRAQTHESTAARRRELLKLEAELKVQEEFHHLPKAEEEEDLLRLAQQEEILALQQEEARNRTKHWRDEARQWELTRESSNVERWQMEMQGLRQKQSEIEDRLHHVQADTAAKDQLSQKLEELEHRVMVRQEQRDLTDASSAVEDVLQRMQEEELFALRWKETLDRGQFDMMEGREWDLMMDSQRRELTKLQIWDMEMHELQQKQKGMEERLSGLRASIEECERQAKAREASTFDAEVAALQQMESLEREHVDSEERRAWDVNLELRHIEEAQKRELRMASLGLQKREAVGRETYETEEQHAFAFLMETQHREEVKVRMAQLELMEQQQCEEELQQRHKKWEEELRAWEAQLKASQVAVEERRQELEAQEKVHLSEVEAEKRKLEVAIQRQADEQREALVKEREQWEVEERLRQDKEQQWNSEMEQLQERRREWERECQEWELQREAWEKEKECMEQERDQEVARINLHGSATAAFARPSTATPVQLSAIQTSMHSMHRCNSAPISGPTVLPPNPTPIDRPWAPTPTSLCPIPSPSLPSGTDPGAAAPEGLPVTANELLPHTTPQTPTDDQTGFRPRPPVSASPAPSVPSPAVSSIGFGTSGLWPARPPTSPAQGAFPHHSETLEHNKGKVEAAAAKPPAGRANRVHPTPSVWRRHSDWEKELADMYDLAAELQRAEELKRGGQPSEPYSQAGKAQPVQQESIHRRQPADVHNPLNGSIKSIDRLPLCPATDAASCPDPKDPAHGALGTSCKPGPQTTQLQNSYTAAHHDYHRRLGNTDGCPFKNPMDCPFKNHKYDVEHCRLDKGMKLSDEVPRSPGSIRSPGGTV